MSRTCRNCTDDITLAVRSEDTMTIDYRALLIATMDHESLCAGCARTAITASNAFAPPPPGVQFGPVAEHDTDDVLRLVRAARIPSLSVFLGPS